MAIQFVIGRAGSGKTHRCLTEIASALRKQPLGPPIYWILPKQATFTAERTLATRVGAFCRARVLSFEQLSRELFACVGGNVIPEVTPLGRQLVIGHLLRQLQPQLHYFSSSARQPGLALELDAAFAEFERSGQTTVDLATLVTDLELAGSTDVDTISLLAKLRDLRLVYGEYERFLGQERLDQPQRLERLLRSLDDCPPLRGSMVYVDGFAQFTAFERQLLAGLGKTCKHVEICLLLDPQSPVIGNHRDLPEDGGLFHQTEQTYRRLRFAFNEVGTAVLDPLRLEAVHRLTKPSLAHLEANLFSEASQPLDSSSGVAMTLAADRQAEVDAVARRIRALWREGVRLREIAVLARNIEPYHTLIESSFDDHGIAYFVDRRRTAAHHPLLQFTRSFLQIVRFDWPNEAVFALMKSGLAGVSPTEADQVENYVTSHSLRGVAWDRPETWAYRRQLTREVDEPVAGEERPQTVDDLRRRVTGKLRTSIAALHTHDTFPVRTIATEIFSVLEEFGVREMLTKWSNDVAESNPEQAAEHGQVWAEFIDLFDQLVDLLGDEPMTLNDFADVLEAGLEQFDLAITPPTVDQVLVGQIDRTRCPEVKATFVLGLNEGEFPRAAREPSILTESERRELRRRNVELDADRRRQLLDEDLLGYIAFTRPSQQLFLSRTRADDAGRPANASRFWERIRAIFPDIPASELPADTRRTPRLMETPRQVVVGLMRWVRAGQMNSDGLSSEDDVWPSLYQWLATYPNRDDAIGRMRELAWPALSYVNAAALTPEHAASLFGTPIETNARQLETFAACPFKHFVRYGLSLARDRTPGITGMDLSQVYHKVLDIIVAEVLEKHADWNRLDEFISPAMIRDYARAIGQTLRGELMMSNARNRYLLDRVERTLGEIIHSQAEMLRRGQFRPGFTGVKFGEQGQLPALRVATPGGTHAIVSGSIDRVDRLPDSDRVAAFDYKLSVGPLAMQDVYHGLSLQLLTYLLVLQSNGEELAGRPLTPVAAFYLPLIRRLGDVDHPSDAVGPDDPKFHLRIKPRGVFDADYFPALDSALDRGRSEVVAAFINKDGGFGYRNSSDVANPNEFAALLEFVKGRIGELADEIIRGRIDITPYRMNRTTPCPQCEFRSVCRFEPAINQYVNLEPMNRERAFARMIEGGEHGE